MERLPNRGIDRSASPDMNAVFVNAHPNLDLPELEKGWAKEYTEKAVDDRELLINELHGVSSRAVQETPQIIAEALTAFEEAVSGSVPEFLKGSYLRACEMNSTYVQSVPFRLKFLRAELFDAEKAALRYVRNLNYLHDKFGDVALMRQLYLSDLSSEEMRFFKQGYIQILPFRDTVGRRIVMHLGSSGGDKFSLETMERVAIYMNFSILSDDETSQRMGAISVSLLNEDAIINTQSIESKYFTRFVQSMPIRLTGWHVCLSNSIRSRIMKALYFTFIQGELRLMTRIHIGTQVECDYALRSFGIPTEHIPLSSTGTLKTVNHKSYLKMRSLIDAHRKKMAGGNYRLYYSSSSNQSPFFAIECPEINSFLVRRNGAAWNYPGNIRLREFLEEKLMDRKRLQENYVRSIAEEIREQNFEILVFDENHSWYNRVTKMDEIQRQVLYIMREIRKRNRLKASPLQSNMSATHAFKGLTDNRSMLMKNTYSCMRSVDNEIPMDKDDSNHRKAKRIRNNQ